MYAAVQQGKGSRESSVFFPDTGTAKFRTRILRIHGFDSIRISFSRGEILQHTGNASGELTRRPKKRVPCTAIFKTNILQTKSSLSPLGLTFPGELPVYWGISPPQDKILIESNPEACRILHWLAYFPNITLCYIGLHTSRGHLLIQDSSRLSIGTAGILNRKRLYTYTMASRQT